ncbi:Hypothetical protein FKW44_012021 [Caligus rogercresseyi]|uniref:Uncharacterized protein n=1 Tax=Caligus rogercresseyi TaxID=217165 RepID=A0A7T8K983_CALRO|nr:Hypothetical protein FKW44_012021 [Caligus rogercresseyi]
MTYPSHSSSILPSAIPSSGSVSADYRDSTLKLHPKVPWTRQSRRRSLSGIALPQQTNEGVLSPSMFICKGSQFGNHLYSPNEPSILVSLEPWILKEDSLMASPLSLANM